MSRLRRLLGRTRSVLEKGVRLTGRGLLFATKVVVNPSRAKWEAEEFYDRNRDRTDNLPERFMNWFDSE